MKTTTQTTKPLTSDQRAALRMMDERNLGAVLVPGSGWVFPCQIRKNDNLGTRVYEILGGK